MNTVHMDIYQTRNEDIGSKPKKPFVSRSYNLGTVCLECSYHNKRMYLACTVRQRKGEVGNSQVELKYKWQDSPSSEWKAVEQWIMRKLLNNPPVDSKLHWYDNSVLVVDDIHSLTCNGIQDSRIIQFIMSYGITIAIMTRFPMVKTFSDADMVCRAMDDISNVSYPLHNNTFGKSIEELKKSITDLSNKISESESEFVNICEKSANSLNILSERFGIELKLNEAKEKEEWR